ncbi:unnamed protein product, partial [Rotaria sordida]
MAADARGQVLNQIVAEGQNLVNTIVTQVQQQFLGLAQQVLGQLSSVVSSLGGRLDVGELLAPL